MAARKAQPLEPACPSSRSTVGRWAVLVLMVCGLTACGSADAGRSDDAPSPSAQRIVSLDYCADQYVLEFAGPEQVAALSPDAAKPFSFHRARAQAWARSGVQRVSPRTEDVLALSPDLVVRAYGGGPNAEAFYARAGIPVLTVGWADDLDGVKRVAREMAAGLGAADAGVALTERVDARIAALQAPTRKHAAIERGTAHPPQTVLYTTPGGVTSGPGSLVHEMIVAAGLSNFETTPGWHPLPLERLAGAKPDRVAHAAFDSHVSPWSAARHPIIRHLQETSDTRTLEGAWTACGGWFLIEAIEALADPGEGG